MNTKIDHLKVLGFKLMIVVGLGMIISAITLVILYIIFP
jgi:hypothetical protein